MLCPVLIGRDEEVQLLRDALDAVPTAHGSTWFVAGEAGVGKSRLVREISRNALARGMTVLTGRAVSGGVPVAFRPLAEAVLSGLRRHDVLELPELRPFRVALGRLLPQVPPHGPVADAESPLVLSEGLLRLLRALADGHSCLLVLEDLQWADRETLAVLEYLADNVAAERIACIGTLRSAEGGFGAESIGTLVGRRAARVVELRRLSAAATVDLARACVGGSELPAEVEDLLVAGSDGLPFLVEELLAGLIGDGVLVEQDGRWSAVGPLEWRVPPTFADAVDRRLVALPVRTQSVLHAAATLGRRFDWFLLAAITGLDEVEVIAALRQAVGAQLLTGDENGFRFRHALTRDAVLGDLVAPQRAGLAARALAAVQQAQPALPGAWCELAAELAELAGDEPRAAELLLDTARRAMTTGALATAETTLDHARRLVADDPPLLVRIDDVLTDVLAQAGYVDRAFEVGDRLLARLDLASHLPSGGAELHLRLARAAVAAGRWSLATEHLAAARSTPPFASIAPAGWTARIDALGAQVALGEGRLDEAGELAAGALRGAERAGLPDTTCEALEVSGRVARQRDLDAAEAAFGRGLAVATAHGLEVWRLRALHELGAVRPARVRRDVERLELARHLAVEAGAPALVATLDLQVAAACQAVPARGWSGGRRGLRRRVAAAAPRHAAHGVAVSGGRVRPAGPRRADGDEVGGGARPGGRTDSTCRAAPGVTAGRPCPCSPGPVTGPSPRWPPVRGCCSVRGRPWHRPFSASTCCCSRRPARRSSSAGPKPSASGPQAVPTPDRRQPAGLRRRRPARPGGPRRRGRCRTRPRGRGHGATGGVVPPVRAPGGRRVCVGRRMGDARAVVAGGRGVLRRPRRSGGCRRVPCVLRDAGAPVPRAGRGDSVLPAALRAMGVTRRKADVLVLVSEGLTNREIATRMHLSPRTVRSTSPACSPRPGAVAGRSWLGIPHAC